MTHSWVIARPTVGHQDVPVVLASGFVATLGITTIVYLLPLVGLPQVDLPLSVARLFVTDPVGAGALGLLVHLLVGFCFAWLFAAQVEPRLVVGPGAAGLLFGVVLWIFVQAVAVPGLGAVAASLGRASATPGVLSTNLGWQAAAASLIAHLTYGGVLGAVYGCHCGGRCR